MTHADIEKAASEIISQKIENKEIVEMSWAVRELIGSMGDIIGDGADFHIICADYYAWRVVKRMVKKFDAVTTAAAKGIQMNLDGFERMQAAYTVKREDAIKLVPVSLMTFEEREEKATLYENFAAGLRQHAKELRTYNESLKIGDQLFAEFQQEVIA
jgi:hypothetical protein